MQFFHKNCIFISLKIIYPIISKIYNLYNMLLPPVAFVAFVAFVA